MGKPRMIILIRHAQSEGNKNREIHQTIPDHRVKLTPEGHRQAQEAGSRLRTLLRPDDTIHFFTSPYRRTRETTEGILQSLSSDSPAPSPFPRHTIKVYEEPRLREQDFGNFQPCSAEMERMWLERADYGHFFYRIPNGESAADAYDRVSGFNESLWRLFGEDDFASVCVLVTHGLMTRVFLMKWYHWSVEYFEDLRNINHCEFVILKLNPDNGKYVLQNQLRTWSDLRWEKEEERQRERAAKGLDPVQPAPAETSVPIRRKWGGCPDGCNHGVRRRSSLRVPRGHNTDHPKHQHDPQSKETTTHSATHNHRSHGNQNGHPRPVPAVTGTSTPVDQHMLRAPEPALGDRSIDARPLGRTLPSPAQQYEFEGVQLETTSTSQATFPTPNASTSTISHLGQPIPNPNPIPRRPGLAHLHRDSEDHLLHPPNCNYAYIHLVGRDGGGSMSGANSLAPSEDERDEKLRPNMHAYTHSHRQTHSRPKPTSSTHQIRPSQDLDNDGDDESSSKQAARPRRTRSHSHHARNPPGLAHQTLSKQVANALSQDRAGQDRSDDEPLPTAPPSSKAENQPVDAHNREDDQYDDHEHYHHHGDDEEDDYNEEDASFEAERKHDQSIRGSVY
ncbi:hypothetical protein CBS147343_5693 [Aspergillus niger]|nr:hypothetical protein CBS12448_1295 [Aspergillus niger]KAI2895681.1 hypothetical protein CBS13152_3749 [Aspergillus niger]KAI2916282.1 hypothetical protein CBS147371_5335 [Aspergillus niger]KAI2976680.1 hypothetical protein CBS147324_2424 [Aspergillus niger]KAI2991788.1 hypothetical protein CBS147344_1176 [Aspergillus niger]